ncbi:MAG: DUF1122 family protein [Candidatus Jordarchaeaceae archaeon]
MLRDAVNQVIKGVLVDDYTIYAKGISRGRFREEINMSLYVRQGEFENYVMDIKVFYGRPPYYSPWVEFFNISNVLKFDNQITEYFDSVIEDKLLSIFSQPLKERESIFVEYYEDEETRRQLGAGLPPPISRLGYKLFKLGFTWFKDWYFAEGFWEGGQKLQGEKPNAESANRQLREIYGEVKTFIDTIQKMKENDWYVVRATVRAKNILSQFNEVEQ